MKSLFFSLILIFLLSVVTVGQEVITLDKALETALGESYRMKNAMYSLTGSQKSLEAVKMGLRTSVDLELDAPYYTRSLASRFNSTTGNEDFYQVGQTRIEGRLSLTQPIVYTNGTLSLNGSLFGREQYPGNDREYFSNLTVRLYQPFLTFNNQMANLERAEINLQRAERNYTRAERDMIYNVTYAFYNLYQAREKLEISREQVRQSEESYETASNKFKAGLIAEVEALRLEVELSSSRNDLLNAGRTYQEMKNDFKLLIGMDISKDIEINADLDFSPAVIDSSVLVAGALERRPELLDAKADIKLSKYDIEETEADGSISGSISANYGINKSDEQFDYIFRDFMDTRSLIITMQIPVWDWGQNKLRVQAAETQLKQNLLDFEYQKENIKNEVISAINRLQAAVERVDVLKRSVEVAQKTYDISLERFKAGKITSFDLSQVQLSLTNAKLNSISAVIDYKISVADLERKAMTDIE